MKIISFNNKENIFTRLSAAAIAFAASATLLCGCSSDTEKPTDGPVLQAGTVEISLTELQKNDYAVTVPISITGHSGFTGVHFGVLFDSRIKPTSGYKTGVLTEIDILSADALNEEKCFYWTSIISNPDTVTGQTPVCEQEGEFWNITFQLPENAASGDIFSIKIPVDGIGNEGVSIVQEETVTPQTIEGAIQITG